MKKVTHEENNDHPNNIQTDLSRDDLIKFEDIDNERIKRKAEFGMEGLLINSKMTLWSMGNLIISTM